MSAIEVNYSQDNGSGMVIHRFIHASPRYLLLVIHGYGDAVGEYSDMAAAFTAHGACVLAPDLPGHGLSNGDSRLIEDLDSVVEALHDMSVNSRWRFPGLPLFVLGHSLGGLIATRYAQRYRHDISGLILAAPLLGETTRITRLLRDTQIDGMSPASQRCTHREWTGPFRKRTLAAMKRMLTLTHTGPGFGSLPVLWLHGTEDSTVLAEETQSTLERLRGSCYYTANIEHGKHNLFTGAVWLQTVVAIQAFIDSQI